jgi:hypothetical protein
MTQISKSAWFLRALVAVTLVSTFVWFCWLQKEMFGYSAVTVNGKTDVGASSNPAVVLMSVLGLVFYLALATVEIRVGESQVASLRSRLAAFLMDSWFLYLCLGGIGSMVSLLLEAYRTGNFQWQFERSYSASSDTIVVALVIISMFLVVPLYFVLSLSGRRQTVGGWIFRLATIDANGNVLYLPLSTAAWRVYKGATGLIHPIRTVKERDAQGRTWYDKETGLTVVRY